ncbi:MAG TPA: hypothetical protein VF331_02890 [Polyangiales bacterium]
MRRLTPFGDELAYRAADAWIRHDVKKLGEWQPAQRDDSPR